jgi:phage portal protein BeeE
MLTLTVGEWTRIRKQLKEEYAWRPSVVLIREAMKRELGFTIRYHKTYTEQRGTEEIIYVDFYSDAAESYFRLKYL